MHIIQQVFVNKFKHYFIKTFIVIMHKSNIPYLCIFPKNMCNPKKALTMPLKNGIINTSFYRYDKINMKGKTS